LNRERIDIAILFDRANVRYFTGFRLNRVVSSILVVPLDREPIYLVAKLDLDRAKRDCWMKNIIPFPEDTPNYLSALAPLLAGGVRRVGVEHDSITLDQADYIREVLEPGGELLDIRPLTARLRAVKSELEIELIRHAAKIADHAMEEVISRLRPQITEVELSVVAECSMLQEGAEGVSFEPFLMSGENSWLPQRVSSCKPLRERELALLDMGAVYEGYCSDLTRTFTVGEVDEGSRRIFRVAYEAQQAAISAVKPGVSARDIDSVARGKIAEAGLGKYFPHLTGHGVGLSSHESPIVDQEVDTVLEPGMVVTVEPGIYVPGVGAARVEDMVLVTPFGHEVLTEAPRELV
jgi:Xaa-Pro aminopeptidase